MSPPPASIETIDCRLQHSNKPNSELNNNVFCFTFDRFTDDWDVTGRDGCLVCLAARLRWVFLSASSCFWVSIWLWFGGWRRRQRQLSLSIIILIDNRPNLSYKYEIITSVIFLSNDLNRLDIGWCVLNTAMGLWSACGVRQDFCS